MGNFYEWNSFQGDDQFQNNQNAQLALESYQEAITLRPQWPYTWSAPALLKYKMSEFDQEFDSP